MTRIGLLSDTHSYLDPKIFTYFSHCDEIWHAGDIGSVEIIDQLSQFKKTRMVFGNIDNHVIRSSINETEIFQLDNQKILITHITGKFGSYNSTTKLLIENEMPQILVCGHSHLLKVAFDKKNNLLYLNPGACGRIGFHTVRTIIRFTMDGAEVKDMEVIELQPRH